MLHYIYLLISFGTGVYLLAQGIFQSVIAGIVFLFFFTIIGYIALFLIQLTIFILIALTIRPDYMPKKINTFYRKFGMATLKVFVDSFRIKVSSSGLEKLPDEPFLIVSNHTCFFDPLVGIELFKKQNVAYVSKQENMKIPFVSRYMRVVGCIPIDRSSPKEALKSIHQAADYIKNGFCSIGIYPEGWENKTDQPLLPFRDGAFRIAKKAGCPIVVSTIKGSKKIFRQFWFKHIHVKIDVLDVIPGDKVKKSKTTELSDIAYHIMYDNLIDEYPNASEAS